MLNMHGDDPEREGPNQTLGERLVLLRNYLYLTFIIGGGVGLNADSLDSLIEIEREVFENVEQLERSPFGITAFVEFTRSIGIPDHLVMLALMGVGTLGILAENPVLTRRLGSETAAAIQIVRQVLRGRNEDDD